jgi:transcriptional regulator with XRE-family HTH domain
MNLVEPSLIADAIKRVMEERNLDRAGFVGLLSGKRKDPSAVSQWTSGKTFPEDEHLVEIANLAGIEPEVLLLEKNSLQLKKKGISIRKVFIDHWLEHSRLLI